MESPRSRQLSGPSLLVFAIAAWSLATAPPVMGSLQPATSAASNFYSEAAAGSVFCPLEFNARLLNSALASCASPCSDGHCCFNLASTIISAQAIYSNVTNILSLTVPQAAACLQTLNESFVHKGLANLDLLTTCIIQETDFTNPLCPATVKELQNRTSLVAMDTVFNQCAHFVTASSLYFPNENTDFNTACQGCQLALRQASLQAAPNVSTGALCTNPLLVHMVGSSTQVWQDPIICSKGLSLVSSVDASICPIAINSADWSLIASACQRAATAPCTPAGSQGSTCKICTREIVRQVAVIAAKDPTVAGISFPSLIEKCMTPLLASIVRFEPFDYAFIFPFATIDCSYTATNATAATCPLSSVGPLGGAVVADLTAKCNGTNATVACAQCVPAVLEAFLSVPGLDAANAAMLQSCGNLLRTFLSALPSPPALGSCFPAIEPYSSSHATTGVNDMLNRLLPAVFDVPAFSLGPAPAPSSMPFSPALAPPPPHKGANGRLPPGSAALAPVALALALTGLLFLAGEQGHKLPGM